MKVKRYVATTSREALAKVKKELGSEAVILSNRSTREGAEILALSPQDAGTIAAPARPLPARPRSAAAMPLVQVAPRVARPAEEAAGTPSITAQAKLYAELKSMRGMVERHLASLAWSEDARRNPLRAQLLRELLAAGFSAPLGRKVSGALPDGGDLAAARVWLKHVLARNVHTGADLVERGGVYALVGPTGVGKTTTVAKIAARGVVRFGASRLALVTTDGYRIGAQDQLRSYARILGVPMHAVQDAAGLDHVLKSLAGKHLVLIDSVGLGQRDARLAEQLELLGDARVRRLLLLNAVAHVETLEDVVNAYRGSGFAGAIVTKLDEARRPGAALDAVIRHRLALAFVTDGQRVPEDIRHPVAAHLVEQALAGAEQSPFALADAELHALPPGGMPTLVAA